MHFSFQFRYQGGIPRKMSGNSLFSGRSLKTASFWRIISQINFWRKFKFLGKYQEKHSLYEAVFCGCCARSDGRACSG